MDYPFKNRQSFIWAKVESFFLISLAGSGMGFVGITCVHKAASVSPAAIGPLYQ